MSYGRFPIQVFNPAFMEKFQEFYRQYAQHYFDHRNDPAYNPNIFSLEPFFLIFLPQHPILPGEEEENYLVTHIVMVETKKVNTAFGTPSAYLEQYLTKFLAFQNGSSRKRYQMSIYARDGFDEYDSFMNRFAQKRYHLRDTPPFAFNTACVFRLQPQHFQFFQEFFQDFTPYQKVINDYRVASFENIIRPMSSL